MSTPESKLETLAEKATAEIGKVKSLWVRWEPYAIAAAAAIVGGFLVHHFHL